MVENQAKNTEYLEDAIDLVQLVAVPFRQWKALLIVLLIGFLFSGYFSFSPKLTLKAIVDPGRIMYPSVKENNNASTSVVAVENISTLLFSSYNLQQISAHINADSFEYISSRNKNPAYTFYSDDRQVAILGFKFFEGKTRLENIEIELTLNVQADWFEEWFRIAMHKLISDNNSNYEKFLNYKHSDSNAVANFPVAGLSDKQIELRDQNYQLQVFSARSASVLNIQSDFESIDSKKLVVGLILSLFTAVMFSFLFDFISRPDVLLRFLAAVREKP